MTAWRDWEPPGRVRALRDRRAIVRRRRSALWQITVALLLATVGAAGLGYLAVQLFYLPDTLAQSRLNHVPDLTGMELEEARSTGESEGYAVIESGKRFADDVEEGEVIYQIPPPDSYLPRGDTLRVLVSLGPGRTTVPDVAGLDPEMAKSILRALGLETTPPRRVPNERYPQGTIVETVPPVGTTVEEGAAITLVLSRGGSILSMPDVRGLPLAAARDSLEIYSLTVGEVTGVEGAPVSEESVEGRVVVNGQDPAPGRNVRAGSAVRLQLGERAGGLPAVRPERAAGDARPGARRPAAPSGEAAPPQPPADEAPVDELPIERPAADEAPVDQPPADVPDEDQPF